MRSRRKPPEPVEIDFAALPGYVGYNLRRTQAAVFRDFARVIGDLDITPGQFGLLTLLAANPGISQIELSRAVGLDKSTVTPAIDRLQARGLLVRGRTPHDRRSYSVRLTPAGAAMQVRLQGLVERHERNIGGVLSAGERKVLLDLLQRVQAALGDNGSTS